MKTVFYLITFVFLLSISSSLTAQFGVRAGVNIADLYYNPNSTNFNPDSKLGLSIGVFYRLPVSKRVVLQPELNFIQHGAKSVATINGKEATNTFSFNYVQVPVMLKFGFGDMDGLNFYVQGGPYIGTGIGKAKSEYCFNGECDLDVANYGDKSDEVKNPDFGLQLGAGVNINENIFVDGRYILGMQILEKEDEVTVKHTGINLSVGYAF